jgi:hypothetical protein
MAGGSAEDRPVIAASRMAVRSVKHLMKVRKVRIGVW